MRSRFRVIHVFSIYAHFNCVDNMQYCDVLRKRNKEMSFSSIYGSRVTNDSFELTHFLNFHRKKVKFDDILVVNDKKF